MKEWWSAESVKNTCHRQTILSRTLAKRSLVHVSKCHPIFQKVDWPIFAKLESMSAPGKEWKKYKISEISWEATRWWESIGDAFTATL